MGLLAQLFGRTPRRQAHFTVETASGVVVHDPSRSEIERLLRLVRSRREGHLIVTRHSTGGFIQTYRHTDGVWYVERRDHPADTQYETTARTLPQVLDIILGWGGGASHNGVVSWSPMDL
jgi:hypothetical protein